MEEGEKTTMCAERASEGGKFGQKWLTKKQKRKSESVK